MHLHGTAKRGDREQIWEYRDRRSRETGHLYILPFVCFQTGTRACQAWGNNKEMSLSRRFPKTKKALDAETKKGGQIGFSKNKEYK